MLGIVLIINLATFLLIYYRLKKALIEGVNEKLQKELEIAKQ